MRAAHPATGNRGRLLVYGVLLVAALGLMATLARCERPLAGNAAGSAGDTLDVAIEYAPVTYYMYDDTLGGFNYDLLRLVARVSGRPFKFHPVVGLREVFDGLDDGRYDLAVAQFPVTSANKSRYRFTQPVYIDRQVLVQRRDSDMVRSQLDLAGDTVVVVAGSPMIERVASLGREIGDTIYLEADDTYGPEQLVLKVAAGEVRRAVVNKSIARHLATRLRDIDCSVDISMSQFQSWAVGNDRADLCDSLNMWLERVKSRYPTQYRSLQQRYFMN